MDIGHFVSPRRLEEWPKKQLSNEVRNNRVSSVDFVSTHLGIKTTLYF